MKVSDYLRQCNKKLTLDINHIIKLKQYYLSMYRYYMLCLYNKGYIDDPTIFDETLIRRNIVELGIKGMKGNLGSYIIESTRVKYALFKNKEEFQQEFLLLLYDVLVYKEYNTSIDKYYEAYGEEYKLNMALDKGMLKPRNGLELTKANLRVLVNWEETIDYYSIESFELETILKSLDIPVVDYCIDKDLTLENMQDLVSVLFGNQPPEELDGEYAERVKSWFDNYNRSLESHFYSHNTNEILGHIFDIVDVLENPEEIVAIYKNRIYVRRPIEYKKFPLGFFGIIGGYNGDDVYINENEVNGFMGEGYTSEYLDEEGFGYIGVPIKVNDYFVFDREQTNIESESWFKDNKMDFEFEHYTLEGIEITSEDMAIQSSKQGKLGILKL